MENAPQLCSFEWLFIYASIQSGRVESSEEWVSQPDMDWKWRLSANDLFILSEKSRKLRATYLWKAHGVNRAFNSSGGGGE